MWSRLAMLLCLPLLGGCTIIRLGDGPNAPVRLYPGVAVVKVAPGPAARIASLETLGLAITGNTATLGYARSDIALVPPGQCNLILWKPRPGTIATLRHLLPDETICTTKEKPQ